MIQIPYNEQIKLIKHGENLATKKLVTEWEQRIMQLENIKGLGPKRLKQIYDVLGVEWGGDEGQ